jgi:opacity protein-like surface antigen
VSPLRSRVALALLLIACSPLAVDAQVASVRGFIDAGATLFSASDSFEAITGSSVAPVAGGGAEVVFRSNLAVNVRISRVRKEGERVFVHEGETFSVGIPTTISIRPVEVGGGYQFRNPRTRLTPYVGGGIGWHRYSETSDFAEASENVNETFTGYHLLGGAEFRILRWFSAGGEAQWTSIPNALGDDPNSASAAFGETNLGGASFRVKFIIGR